MKRYKSALFIIKVATVTIVLALSSKLGEVFLARKNVIPKLMGFKFVSFINSCFDIYF